MAIVYTGGTFDLLHAGHIDFLEACYKLTNIGKVVVALNTDEFVERFKGKKPVCSFDERKRMLEGCKYVDLVVENIGEEDSKKTIEELRQSYYSGKTYPDFIAIGDDWLAKDYYAQMGFTPQWLLERNISLVYIARLRQLSSTAIKERMNNGLVDISTVPAEQIGFVRKMLKQFRSSIS